MNIAGKKIICHCSREMAFHVEEDTYFKCPDGHKIGYYEAVGREMSRAHQSINMSVSDEHI